MKVLAATLAAVFVVLPASSGPVDKVVELLTELQGRIEQDGKSEQEVYDKFACWCEKTTGKYATSIEEGKTEMKRLGNQILELKGTVASTAAEIKQLAEDIEKNEDSQAKLTNIRSKENAAFLAEKAEMQQATAALEKAIIVLRDATSASLLQSRSAMMNSLVADIPEGAKLRLNPRQLSALSKLTHRGSASYAPQSATIQGILQDMYETFTGNLESSTHDEATAHRNYEDLMHTYQEELVTLQETLMKKERAKAEAETMLADATQSYADSEEELKANVKFFDATKESCEKKTEEWSERHNLRTEELAGISEALNVLTSDDAKALFGKAIDNKPSSFLQVQASSPIVTASTPLSRAFGALEVNARKSKSIRLAALAASIRSDGKITDVGHFDKVIEAIDTLIATLVDEGKKDEEHEQTCKDENQAIDLSVQDLEWKIKNNEAAIQKLEKAITTKTEEKEGTVEQLSDVAGEITGMEDSRKEENSAFLQAKDDDEKAIVLLKQAKDAMEKYYKDNDIKQGPLEGNRLLQLGRADPEKKDAFASEDTAPEAKFSGKGNSKNASKGVVALLQTIIENLQVEIADGVKAEESGQLDFEARLKAAKGLKSDLETKRTNLEEMIALHDSKKEDEKGTMGENKDEAGTKEGEKEAMKPSCDFILKNIGVRREKRATEMEGLTAAKQFLAGARPAMLQKFDDSAFPQIGFQGVSFLQRHS